MPASRSSIVATPDSISSGIVSDRASSCCPSEDNATLTSTSPRDYHHPSSSYTSLQVPSPAAAAPVLPAYTVQTTNQANHQPARRLPVCPTQNNFSSFVCNSSHGHGGRATVATSTTSTRSANIYTNQGQGQGNVYVATGLPSQHAPAYNIQLYTSDVDLDADDGTGCDVAYNNDITHWPAPETSSSSRLQQQTNINSYNNNINYNDKNSSIRVAAATVTTSPRERRKQHRHHRSMTPIINNANIRNHENSNQLQHLYQQQQQRGRQLALHHERSTSASRLPVFVADSFGDDEGEGRAVNIASHAPHQQISSSSSNSRRALSQPRMRPKTPTEVTMMQQQQFYLHQLQQQQEKPRLKEFLHSIPNAHQQHQPASARVSRCPSRGPLIALPQTPRNVRESLPQGITVTNLLPQQQRQGRGHISNAPQQRDVASFSSADNAYASTDSLPDAVLVNILSYLPSHLLCRCAGVNRRWSDLVWSPALWKTIDLQDSPAWLDVDKALKCLTQRLSQQTPGVCAIVDTIRLAGCATLSDKGLYAIAKSCHELQFLDITGCHLVTNIALFDVFSRCPNLVHLTVAGCLNISCLCLTPEATVQAVTYGQQSCLAYLDMGECGQLQDAGLQIIASYCPRLTCLYLRRCSRITDVGVQYVAAYCRSLGELSVSDCTGVTDAGVQDLACKLGPTLHYLSVGKCRITDTGVRFVATYCRKLRYLNMRGCEGVTDASVQLLARNCARLRSLDIGKCDVTDASLACLAVHCGAQLRKLGLKECVGISDAGLLALARGCPSLQQLNISQCPTTLAGYKTIRRLCKDCVVEHTNL